MTYKKADYIELIDTNMSFKLSGPDGQGVSTWSYMAKEDFEPDNQLNIMGSDIVKIARIFGQDADVNDTVHKYDPADRRGENWQTVGDMQIPLWRPWPHETIVYSLSVQINESGTVDIKFNHAKNDHESEITYNGAYYVEWLTD